MIDMKNIMFRVWRSIHTRFNNKFFVLSALLMSFCIAGCKQSINEPDKGKTANGGPNKVVITIKGDTYIKINGDVTLKEAQDTAWKSIKEKCEKKLSFKDNRVLSEWRLQNDKGKILTDGYKFTSNTTIFAVSKARENDPKKIVITINIDSGYEWKKAGDNKIEVAKSSLWKDVKNQAIHKTILRKNYEQLSWKIGNENGVDLNDDYSFTAAVTIFAKSQVKGSSTPHKITITLAGDENIDITGSNTLTVDSPSLWGCIKEEAAKKVKAKDNFKIKEWKLNNDKGAILSDPYTFYKDAGIFAVSEAKGNEPEKVVITINIDSGCEWKKAGDNKIEVAKSSLWKDVKKQAIEKIILRKNYEQLSWKIGNENGADLNDDYAFTQAETIFAKSQAKGTPSPQKITITVLGDSDIDIILPNTLTVDKGCTWGNIKENVITKAEAKDNFRIKEWRGGGLNGKILTDEYVFNINTRVFAISERGENDPQKIIITVGFDADFYELINANNSTIEVNKGSLWKDIKKQAAEKIIQLRTRTDFLCAHKEWWLDDKNGGILNDDNRVFNQNAKIYALGKKQIRLHIRHSDGYTSASGFPVKSLEIEYGIRWGDIKKNVEARFKLKKYFEPAGWKLNDKNGNELTDDYVFTKIDETIYADAKHKKVRYTVNHLKQDIVKLDEYLIFETETKEGLVAASTEAEAKTYTGFDLLDQNIEQKKIEEDNSTVVEIKYKRKFVNLILDLQGGKTTATLDDHEGDTKRISGIFESDVSIADPAKECHVFKGWEPPLPTKFLMENDGQKFVAKWELEDVAIIKGDERFDTSQPIYIDISNGHKTWKDIKNEAADKLKLKEEWPSDSYGIYDWRIGDENGAKVEDSTIITKNMVFFARSTFTAYYYDTNNGEKKLVGPEYGKYMKGNIIIPHDITIIGEKAFSEYKYNYGITRFDFSECKLLKEIQNGKHSDSSAFSGCLELEMVDFSGCTNLEKIGNYAFASCTELKSITFAGCMKLAAIGKEAFSGRLQLETVDFSNCTNLNTIGDSAFLGCSKLESINLTGCTNLETIGVDAFGNTNNK